MLIENFRYHGGDDVIAIKSGWDCFGYHYNHSTRDVVIRNVTAVYSEAAGCAIGSDETKPVFTVDCAASMQENTIQISSYISVEYSFADHRLSRSNAARLTQGKFRR